MILIYIFSDNLSRIFTHDEEVVVIIYSVLWVILAYIFFDTIHGVMGGIIRGLGR